MELRKKFIAILLILTFILNMFSILNNVHLNSPISDKINKNSSQNNQVLVSNDYNYWYNYTLHKLNETGMLTDVFTPIQSKILENVTLTYLLREEDYFITPQYNRFEYWEAWVWNNLIPIYWGNITYNFFQTHASRCVKDSLTNVIQIYWRLMINNLTISEADAFLAQLPLPEEPDPLIIDFQITKAWDSKIEGSFKAYIPYLAVFAYDLEYCIGTTQDYPGYSEYKVVLYEDLHWDWPGHTGDKTFHFSIDNPGYIGAYDLRMCYYKWWYWGVHEAGTSGSVDDPFESRTFPVNDDDDAHPSLKLQGATGDISKNYVGDYSITITYDDTPLTPDIPDDDAGWKGQMVLRYERTDMGDYGEFNIDMGECLQDSGSLTFNIPKNAGNLYDWGNWIDSTKTVIKFRHRAADMDDDNIDIPYDPRGSDELWSSWYPGDADWAIAGTIWSQPGASILSIEQQKIMREADQWVWKSADIQYDGIYMNQPFTVNFQVTNPTGDTMQVRGGTIEFDSVDLPVPVTSTFWDTPESINAEDSLVELFIETLNYNTFTSESTDLDITITFEYQISGLPFESYSFIETYYLFKPPDPTVGFIGFEGPKDNPTDSHFVYKTQSGEASSIRAVFEVDNPARIPIKLTHQLDFLSTGRTDLLQIVNPPITSINPGNYEIKVQLNVLSTIFFAEVANWLSLSDTTIRDLLLFQAILQAYMDFRYGWVFLEQADAYIKLAKPAKGWGVAVIEALLATIETLMLTSMDSMPKDENRQYYFSIEDSWEYQINPEGETIPHTDLGYNNIIQTISNMLELKPSQYQRDQYNTGWILGWVAIGLSVVSCVLYYCLPPPWNLLFSIVASILSMITGFLSSHFFKGANDPPFTDSNYTEVIEPSYRNVSLPEPQNSFQESLNGLTNSSVKLEGDLKALNTSIARKNAAIAVGDNESIIMQNDAVYNYSRMVGDDFGETSEELVVFNNEFNESVTEDNITQVEDGITLGGMPQSDRETLIQLGYSNSSIDEVTEYARNVTVSQSPSIFRRAFQNTSKNFIASVSICYDQMQKESRYYEELAQESLNESIILKNTIQNKPITTADPDTLERLEILLIQADNRLYEKSWSAAIELATELKNLALDTIEETLNQTYFFYVEEADRIIENAEEKMKIELIPSKKEIEINAGVPETLNLIVLSTGAPSGTYKLISNSSWVKPMIQDVDIVEWKSTTVPLTIHLIESFDIEPGEYPINLTISLEGTDIKKSMIITAIVVSTKVENMMNYILYEIADLRVEVDARVSFLFDWIIINRLDAAECVLNEALEAYLDEAIPKSVVLDKLAKANIELSDVITIILDWIGLISEEDGYFISTYLHTIRDHITLTMGATVGTEEAMKVAQIEAEIEQLADQIFTEYCLLTALRIDLKLWVASENLDFALLWMADGCGDIAELHIILSIHALENAKCKIIDYALEGKIPANEADALLLTIDGFIAELEPLHTHYTHDGDCGDGDMHTHQGTEESNEVGDSDSSGTGGHAETPNAEMPSH